MKKFALALSLTTFSCLLVNPALAFHSGGVAECEGCHTMHNSYQGAPVTAKFSEFQAGPYLLQAADQSSTCLNCHEGVGQQHNISTPLASMPTGTPPQNLTPAGDFGWLKKSYFWTTANGSFTSKGERHGHNIVATDYGYVADITQSVSPGGSYPAGNLSCISCHDPHGKYRILVNGGVQVTTGAPIYTSGSYGDIPKSVNGYTYAVGVYRILGGSGYLPKSLAGSGVSAFSYGAPYAVAPATYNVSETTYTGTRVAYGSNASKWCSNCHYEMHSALNDVGIVHPVDQTLSGGDEMTNYNSYITSGKMTGSSATAYLSLVPFCSDNERNLATLKTQTTSKAGPTPSYSTVGCFSCHRAHASGFDSMTRWENGHEFLTVLDSSNNIVYPAIDTTPSMPDQAEGRLAAEKQQAYYGRPASIWSGYQRVLCNKCHAKD